MKILYKLKDFPEPGDQDLYNGIQEINKNDYKEAFKYFEKGSNYNNEYASLFHALLYLTGFGFAKRDPAKAMNLLKTVALEYNNFVAQFLISVMYCHGDKGISQHSKFSNHWALLAANNGWSDNMTSLGISYVIGDSTEEDNKKGFELLDKVSRKDDSDTEIDDGAVYLFGNKDFEIVVDIAERQAIMVMTVVTSSKQVSPISLLGSLDPFLDHHFDNNLKSTIFWNSLTNKKSSGVALAQFFLATLLISGKTGIPVDNRKSIYWLKKAAKNMNSEACFVLAKVYEFGLRGLNKDYVEALKWYKAANKLGGDIESAYRIAVFYYNEWGVESNCRLALCYFKERVNHSDHGPSYLFMGDIYEHGKDGVSQDYQKARECYEKAYKCGEIRATHVLGKMYFLGLGVKSDPYKARQWVNKASTMKASPSPAPTGPLGLFISMAKNGAFK